MKTEQFNVNLDSKLVRLIKKDAIRTKKSRDGMAEIVWRFAFSMKQEQRDDFFKRAAGASGRRIKL